MAPWQSQCGEVCSDVGLVVGFGGFNVWVLVVVSVCSVLPPDLGCSSALVPKKGMCGCLRSFFCPLK